VSAGGGEGESPRATDRPDAGSGLNSHTDGIDLRLEGSLSALAGATGEAPPMSGALAAELDGLAPATMRMPRRAWAAVLVISLFYALGLLAWMGVRDDLDRLPAMWLYGVGAVWLAAFLAIGWLILVPPRRQVMPRWRSATALAGLAALLLMVGGLILPESVATVGATYAPSVASVFEHGHSCLRAGLAVAVVPIVVSALAVRGAVPVGSRWVAVAIGAAGGALGGLILHLHCATGERFHIGLVHGGLIVVSAALAAIAARVGERIRWARER